MDNLSEWDEFKNNSHKAELIYDGVLWTTKPVAYYLLCVAIFGAFGNSAIIFLTIRTRNFRHTCNFLIALMCGCGMVHQIGIYIFASVVLSGQMFIPLQICLYIQTIPLIANLFGEILPFLIGIDRLLSFFFPVLHRKTNKRNHCIASLFICLFYSFLNVRGAYIYANNHPNEAVTCVVIDAIAGPTSQRHFTACALINIIVILLYFVVWIGLKTKKSIRETNNKRLFKSLAVIVSTIFASWFSISTLRLIFITAGVGQIGMFWLRMVSVSVINTNCAAQSYILFAFSKDYRRSFFLALKNKKLLVFTTVHVKTTIHQRSNTIA